MSVRSVAGASFAKTRMSDVFVLTQLTQAADLLRQKVPNKREPVWRVSVSFVWKSQIVLNKLSIKQDSDAKSAYFLSYLRCVHANRASNERTSHRRGQQAAAISKR